MNCQNTNITFEREKTREGKKKKEETLDSTRTQKLLVHTDVRLSVIKQRLNPDHTL